MKINQLFLVSVVGFISCTETDPMPGGAPGTNSADWLVPADQVFGGGPGRDGIPALENPEMVSANAIDYLSPESLVVGFKSGNDIRAYPHAILDWHEIINDTYPDKKLAITYCPLTGTAIGWNPTLNGQTTTFGVSGLLYQTNLMPFDRLTGSTWSQMRMDCVNGDLIGTEAETFQVVETTWDTWKEMYPSTQVNSLNTGFSRNYQRYPYQSGGRDYRTNDTYFLFPFSPVDSRLPAKDRVLGVIVDDDVKVYPLLSMEDQVTIITDDFLDIPLVIAGSRTKNFIVAFETIPGLSFTPLQDQLPLVMEDNEGNQWSIFGEALTGPRSGQRLKPTQSLIGYWFTFGSFYPTPEIFGQES